MSSRYTVALGLAIAAYAPFASAQTTDTKRTLQATRFAEQADIINKDSLAQRIGMTSFHPDSVSEEQDERLEKALHDAFNKHVPEYDTAIPKVDDLYLRPVEEGDSTVLYNFTPVKDKLWSDIQNVSQGDMTKQKLHDIIDTTLQKSDTDNDYTVTSKEYKSFSLGETYQTVKEP